MKTRRRFSVLLLAPMILSSLSTKAQQPTVKQPPTTTFTLQHKEAAELERKERRLQLISYLDGIAQKANLLDVIEDRVRVLIEVGDAFWLLDKARARTLFKQSFQTIDNLSSEPEERNRIANRISSLRQLTLTRIARRDAELAATLLQKAAAPTTDERRPNDMNGETTANAEMLIQIARSILKTHPKQSTYLAQLALRDGLSQTARIYIQELRDTDRATADLLIAQALSKARLAIPAGSLMCWHSGNTHFNPARSISAPSHGPKTIRYLRIPYRPH